MACELLIKNKDTNSLKEEAFRLGDIIEVRDIPHAGWGKMEKYPEFLIINIPDSNRENLLKYCQPYSINISYDIIDYNKKKDEYIIEFNAEKIRKKNTGNKLFSHLKDFFKIANINISAKSNDYIRAKISIIDYFKSKWIWEDMASFINIKCNDIIDEIYYIEISFEYNYNAIIRVQEKLNELKIEFTSDLLNNNAILKMNINKDIILQNIIDTVINIPIILNKSKYYINTKKIDDFRNAINLTGYIEMNEKDFIKLINNKESV